MAAGTSPRKTPQSCVGRFVVMSVDAVSWRRTKTSSRSSAAVGPELLHAEVFEDEEVDARQVLDEVAPRAGRFGLGEVSGQIEGAADEGPTAGADRADRRSPWRCAICRRPAAQ